MRFIGGGGKHASGISSIGDGVVGVITVTNPGSGYVVSPTITFTGDSIVSADLRQQLLEMMVTSSQLTLPMLV